MRYEIKYIIHGKKYKPGNILDLKLSSITLEIYVVDLTFYSLFLNLK
jgi:hypothetical protein